MLTERSRPRETAENPEQVRRRIETADRQLEMADMYLAAMENVGLKDRHIDQALRQLRGDLNELRRLLVRPHVV